MIGVLLVAAIGAMAMDDKAQSPIEVYEWSVWVGNPAQPAVNASRIYTNAMPVVVGTSRPKVEEKEAAARFPLSPVSVVQFFGEPCRDIDVDLKVKQGTFLSHWPASNERGGRLQWFKSDLSKAPPPQIPPSYSARESLVPKLRDGDSALYLKYESHFERFIAYDSELTLPMPVQDSRRAGRIHPAKLDGPPAAGCRRHRAHARRLPGRLARRASDRGARRRKGEGKEETDEAAAKKKSDKEKADAFFKEGEKKKERRRAPSPSRRRGRERQGQGRPAAQPSGRRDGRKSPAARCARPDHRPSAAPL